MPPWAPATMVKATATGEKRTGGKTSGFVGGPDGSRGSRRSQGATLVLPDWLSAAAGGEDGKVSKGGSRMYDSTYVEQSKNEIEAQRIK